MSIHQVEQYYMHLAGLNLTPETKAAVEELLSDSGYSSYEFDDSIGELTVDDIEDERDGEILQEQIFEIVS